jgi:hypothetical protein
VDALAGRFERRMGASPIGDVHGDFHAKPEINRSRGFPFHDASPRSSASIIHHGLLRGINCIMNLAS